MAEYSVLHESSVGPHGVDVMRLRIEPGEVRIETLEWTVLHLISPPGPVAGLVRDQVEYAVAVRPGVTILIPPDHRAILNSTTGLLGDLVLWPESIASPLERALPDPTGGRNQSTPPFLDPWVTRRLRELSSGAPAPGTEHSLLRWLLRRSGVQTHVPSREDPLSPDTLVHVVDRLEATLTLSFDVQRMAHELGHSRALFSRSFRAALGHAPSRYFAALRVEHAARMLHRPGHVPLQSVALESGFYDQSHLTRQFRRWTGFTPGRYAGLVSAARGAR